MFMRTLGQMLNYFQRAFSYLNIIDSNNSEGNNLYKGCHLLIGISVVALLNCLWNKIKKSKHVHHDDVEPCSETLQNDKYSPALPEVEHVPYVGATITLPGGSEQFYKMANDRRSIRCFKKTPKPPIGVIENCIRTAGTAPSGAHTEPWTFCVIQDQSIKCQIREIVETEEFINYTQRMHKQWVADLRPLKTNHIKTYLTDAPYLILLFKQVYSFAENGTRKQHYYNEMSVSISLGILLCVLQAAGINSLVTTPLNCGPSLRKLLQRPFNEKLLALIPIGYAASDCKVPNLQRKNLNEIMFKY